MNWKQIVPLGLLVATFSAGGAWYSVKGQVAANKEQAASNEKAIEAIVPAAQQAAAQAVYTFCITIEKKPQDECAEEWIKAMANIEDGE